MNKDEVIEYLKQIIEEVEDANANRLTISYEFQDDSLEIFKSAIALLSASPGERDGLEIAAYEVISKDGKFFALWPFDDVSKMAAQCPELLEHFRLVPLVRGDQAIAGESK